VTADPPTFGLQVDQNPNLAVGAHRVHAILEISASAGHSAPDAAEVVIIDTSSSMIGEKIEQARLAAAAAVDSLRDGVFFAVVSGASIATVVYPPQAGMVRADPATRAEAKVALAALEARGATAMSTWLRLAHELLGSCPAELKHALMLTDGQNVEGTAHLAAALKACAGQFGCDCRGVGEDWSMTQLKQIAGVLLGTWKPIAEPERLSEDFRKVMAASMRKRVAGVVLRVRKPPVARIAYFGRVLPDIEDLSDKGVEREGGRVVEFPIGSWGAEVRAYDLQIVLEQADLRIETGTLGRAAGVEVVLPAPEPDAAPLVAARGSVLVTWTRNAVLSSRINERVAGYTGQQELALAVNQAVRAWDAQQEQEAAKLLGHAVALAYRLGREDVLEQLSQLAEIEDPAAGLVRPRPRGQVPRRHIHDSAWLSEQSRPVDGGQ
jgi:uncharacterized protein YegL